MPFISNPAEYVHFHGTNHNGGRWNTCWLVWIQGGVWIVSFLKYCYNAGRDGYIHPGCTVYFPSLSPFLWPGPVPRKDAGTAPLPPSPYPRTFGRANHGNIDFGPLWSFMLPRCLSPALKGSAVSLGVTTAFFGYKTIFFVWLPFVIIRL